MNKILEALEEDRFVFWCPIVPEKDGPWTLQEVAQILGSARRDGRVACFGWEHQIELIEVTN